MMFSWMYTKRLKQPAVSLENKIFCFTAKQIKTIRVNCFLRHFYFPELWRLKLRVQVQKVLETCEEFLPRILHRK